MKLLATARWPVGGIKTFLRYVYGDDAFQDCEITLVGPDYGVRDYIAGYIPGERLAMHPAPDSHRALTRSIRDHLRRGDYDLVHSHGFTAGVLTELARIGHRQIPHLMTAHDVFLPSSFQGWRGALRRRGMARLFERLVAVHAVTQDNADNFREYFPDVPTQRIVPILHGVDTQALARAEPIDVRQMLDLPPDAAVLGFFGRFMSQKAFRVLVDAVERLTDDGAVERPIRVVTFGWGGFIREDYEYLREKGLGKHFLQQPQTDDPAAWMKGMDVIAMPSRWEACGLLAMEALAAGVPIVGTSCIGLREVLKGTPARMVRPDDAGALAEALAKELNEPRRQAFVDYQPEAVRRFAVDRAARELRDLYDQLTPAR